MLHKFKFYFRITKDFNGSFGHTTVQQTLKSQTEDGKGRSDLKQRRKRKHRRRGVLTRKNMRRRRRCCYAERTDGERGREPGPKTKKVRSTFTWQ